MRVPTTYFLGAPSTTHTEARINVQTRSASARAATLRHNDDITGFQKHVGVEILRFEHIVVVEDEP